MSPPPEVIFDRCLRNNPCAQERERYKGKQDLDLLPSEQGTVLRNLQDALNNALHSEDQTVAAHVSHPPFHFDYVAANVPNAIAFRCDDYSFIGVTIPLVSLLDETCHRLSTSPQVAISLGARPELAEPIASILFASQLTFVVAHEYTHIVHGHCPAMQAEVMFPNEIKDTDVGNLASQAHETDADSYAVYHVLQHLFNNERRPHTVGLLEIDEKSTDVQDAILLASFVIAVGGFLYVRPPVAIDAIRVYKLTHPPQAVRMNLVMHGVKQWCKQNRPTLGQWMTLERFQTLMNAVAVATWGMNGGRNWSEQTTFLRSADGDKYIRQLDACFKQHVESLGK